MTSIYENIRAWVKEKYPTEYALNQIKEDATFASVYEAATTYDSKKFRKALISESCDSMDTMLRDRIWSGMKERFGISADTLNRIYFSNVEAIEVEGPFSSSGR